jgi:anti-anti-sigma factor
VSLASCTAPLGMRQRRCVTRLTGFGQPLDAARLRSDGTGVAYSAAGGVMSLSPAENTLMSTRPMEKTIAAPERLDLESRTAFRRAAGEVLDVLAEGAGRLVIDLSGTRSVDSAGLGALMLIQRKAAERRQTVCLRGANEELRFLLVLTKLDDLFELETGVS